MRELKIRISGRGGQGIVLSGKVLGTAIAKSGKEVMYTQEYGSRARGGVVYSDLIISDSEVNEVLIEEADILVTLSQNAYDDLKAILKEGGKLIINSDLVEPKREDSFNIERLPFSSFGFQAGNKKTANMAMIAYINERFNLVPYKRLEKTMRESISAMMKENLKAFKLGYEKAREKPKTPKL